MFNNKLERKLIKYYRALNFLNNTNNLSINFSNTMATDSTVDATKLQKKIKNDAKKAEKLQKYLAKEAKNKQNNTKKLGALAANNDEEGSHSGFALENAEIQVNKKTSEERSPKNPVDFMESSYNPRLIEKKWYSWWENNGVFKPEVILKKNPSAPKYVLPIPPPNVTGYLHLGHAMATSIQDSLVRWKRMKGFAALYIPGCDHAGISCQVVVEKNLQKFKNVTRHELGREGFVAEVWKWKDEHGNQIYEQLKRLGGSMDWDRVKFTLDPPLNEAVTEAFVSLFDKKIIYRANRLVNWSSKLQTTVSDLEVDHMEINEPTRLSVFGHDKKKTYEFGFLTQIAYKVSDGELEDEICVSTTRPETIPGDVAVAVHPEDSRYLKYHGKYLRHPIHDTLIPLVLDTYANMDFGTGAVKVTPAHDANDFEISQRHALNVVNILDENNCLNQNAGPMFQGMIRFDARVAIIEYLKQKGLFRGSTPHKMTLPICNRSGDIIEPRIFPQWWMKCQDVSKQCIQVVKDKKLKLIPVESEKIWFNWLENSRDWCLSRQLWWGHRIPAYSIQTRTSSSQPFTHSLWIAARNEKELEERISKELPNVSRDNISFSQDPDVLDTWFSSGLWPFSILGWPNTSSLDFKAFYPNSILETGRDIIFFWVARMVMMGLLLTDKLPFDTVFLHSIVRDAHGRKMSKSLGNVVDPIDVIEGISLEALHKGLELGNLDKTEVAKAKASQKKDFPHGIKECGADALRFALCNYTSQGSDINLDILRVEGYRRFCNKIWNACKFSLMKLGSEFQPLSCQDFKLNGKEKLFERWILYKLNSTIIEVDGFLQDYNFMKATSSIYNFLLYEFCDVYIEVFKSYSSNPLDSISLDHSKNILYICLETGLKLLHPFMPFITEELYQKLPKPLSNDNSDSIQSISTSEFPVKNEQWAALSSSLVDVNFLQNIVKFIRNKINSNQIKSSIEVFIAMNNDNVQENSTKKDLILDETNSILSLVKGLRSLSILESDSEEFLKEKTHPKLILSSSLDETNGFFIGIKEIN